MADRLIFSKDKNPFYLTALKIMMKCLQQSYSNNYIITIEVLKIDHKGGCIYNQLISNLILRIP